MTNQEESTDLGSRPQKPTAAIDFETFYDKDYSLEDLEVWTYVSDPRFECYQVAIEGVDRDGNPVSFVGPPADAPWGRVSGIVWVSHNATFDRQVWERLRQTNPDISAPGEWHCTANLAVYLQAPRNLAGAARELLGEEVAKVYREPTKGKHFHELTDTEQKVVREAGLADARACLMLWQRYEADWPDQERRLAQLTYKTADRGVHVDWGRVEGYVEELVKLKLEAERKLPWVELGRRPLSKKAVSEYCQGQGIPCPSSLAMKSKECAAWEAQYSEQHPFIAATRIYRRSNFLLRRLEQTQRLRRVDGTIPVMLRYMRAPHTGRWSGEKANLQNLPRDKYCGVDLRSCFVPRPGHLFVIADLSQIEPRILALLSGDTTLLKEIKSGMPIYEAYARENMGWCGGSLKEEDPDLYRLAKAMVLGLGYGCSHVKFQAVAKALTGLDLSLAECRRAVRSFRSKNPKITRLWKLYKRKIYRAARADKYLEIPLRSGRIVRYFDIAFKSKKAGYRAFTTQGGVRERKIYGAKLVENLVQATARDVFADMLLRLDSAGIDIVFHVHDEVVCQVPAGEATVYQERIHSIMCEPPEWMPDLPVEVESSVSEVYKK